MDTIFQVYTEWSESPRWGNGPCIACQNRDCYFVIGQHGVLTKRLEELNEELPYHLFADLPSVRVCLDCYIAHRISQGLVLKDASEWVFHMPKIVQTYASGYDDLLKMRDRSLTYVRNGLKKMIELKRFIPRDIRQRLQECVKMDVELKTSMRLKTTSPYYWAGATGREAEFFDSGFKELLKDDCFRHRKYTDYFAAKLGSEIRIPPFAYKLEEIRLKWHSRLFPG
jgi:hypothetical protein